jgi:microcystin-dependent protein
MEFYLGQVCLFPWNWEMEGWAKCDGRLMPVVQNSALFSLLGAHFGGDMRNTFGLPNLLPVKDTKGAELTYYIAIQGIYPSRA